MATNGAPWSGPFSPVHEPAQPATRSPSRSLVHENDSTSLSRSHEDEALKTTSPCEEKMDSSVGVAHIKKGAWLSSGNKHETMRSWSSVVLVELVMLS